MVKQRDLGASLMILLWSGSTATFQFARVCDINSEREDEMLGYFKVLLNALFNNLGASEEEPLLPIANHVVHIGIDGLRPDCIGLAPGGAPNILQRLGEGVSLRHLCVK